MKTLTLTMIALTCIFIFGCGDSPETNSVSMPTIQLKGHFQTIQALSQSGTPSKILTINVWGGCRLTSISDGAFAADVEQDIPAVMILLDDNDQSLGYLTLGNGIDSLPMTKLKSGTQEIDLGALTLSSGILEPAHNPVGQELELNADEQIAYAFANNAFASLARKPDVDGNGVIDCLENKRFNPLFMYYIKAGNFSGSVSATPTIPAFIDYWDFAFDVRGVAVPTPEDISFTGPVGSGLNNSDCCHYLYPGQFYQAPLVSHPSLPVAGTYTVNFGQMTLNFPMGNQANANSNIIIAIPTLIVDGDRLEKISWVYKLGNGNSVTMDMSAFIQNLQIQIDSTDVPCAQYNQGGQRTYDSPKLSPDSTEHTLSCGNIHVSKMQRLNIAYNDVFGNHYVMHWQP
jgi:hypothetical protein